ncbi:MAG: M28 family peptidase, partial [Sphingobacteriales bacterium]
MKTPLNPSIFLALLLLFAACGNSEQKDQPEEQQTSKPLQRPDFNPDSAYSYIQAQVDFGPRVPGTPAQLQCAAYMEDKLRKHCDTVYRQETKVNAGNGKSLPCINLIGVINPEARTRILLLAHWDSRPWSDMDPVDTLKAVSAADDGASGVGVLLELARQVSSQPLPPDIGVDILLTDVEDYGKTEWGDKSYALGTQYWAYNPHIPGYSASFGILLDMVGAKGARFPLEGVSSQLAPAVQQLVWKAAATAGFSSYFIYQQGASITDDHVFIN